MNKHPTYLRNPSACLGAVVVAFTAGCSSQQLYGGVQAGQRNECQRIQDFHERKRCIDSASLSYEEYHKEAARAKSGK